ncbi:MULTISPECIES: hypothetical protein [Sphingomonas]|uniref:hypothetical protein n=1 Tax=Sphingomonas TaxID=13687 RepID=UPI0013B45588|nr:MULTISPECIES: hypothetical protein [Sphingomonas]
MSTRTYQLTALRYGVEQKIHAELLRRIPDAVKLLRLRRLSGLLRRRLTRHAWA